MDFKSIDTIYLAVGFLVPGLIISYVRAQFFTGRTSKQTDSLLSFLTLSVIYYGFTAPVLPWLLSIHDESYLKLAVWYCLVIVGPAAFGILISIPSRTGIIRKLFGKLGLSPVHSMPTAWDWRFSDKNQSWLIVTLKDGTVFAGYFGGSSFASSDPSERDIYIEKVYNIDSSNSWTETGEKGVLISKDVIQSVEFLPVN